MALEFEDHPFWDLSIKVYGTDGVPAACLVLQEKCGIDVNVMLFCSWVGHSGHGVMNGDELTRTLDAVSEWHDHIVRALRAVRQRLRGGLPPAPEALSAALRRRILKIEVDCEHTEQLMLADTLERKPDDSLAPERRAADALANIANYFSRREIVADGEDADQLAIILGAAFTELESGRVASLCRGSVSSATT